MSLSAYSMDLRRTVTPQHHIFAVSGACSVQPLVTTVAGVGDLFGPPIVARQMRLITHLDLDGRLVSDTGDYGCKGDVGILYGGGTWHLDGVERKGAYHHYREGRLDSLAVESRLTPLPDAAGYILRLTVTNRGAGIKSFNWQPALETGSYTLRPLGTWDFPIPVGTEPVDQVSAQVWQNDDLKVELFNRNRPQPLASGASVTLWIALRIVPRDSSAGPLPENLERYEAECLRRRREEMSAIVDRFPSLETDIPGLGEYYNRSLVSGLVSVWNNPAFAVNPWVATSGVDGGGVCAYPWDNAGYPPNAMVLMFGEHTDKLIELFARSGLDRNNRVSLEGEGMNCYYAYSLWSFVALLDARARLLGLPSDAQLDEAARLLDAAEQARPQRGHLINYGDQSNLLEMRSSGWEHFVSSPNAERAWCFDTLANLFERRGDTQRVAAWRRKAAAIRKAIRSELWNADKGWFRSIFPDGHEEYVYTIQAYDALRLGACTPAMKSRLLEHLRDGAFLGRYGVSSVSGEDQAHYDFNDPDWGGGGSFSGDGPALALTLWETKQPRLAWDVLSRYFWTGHHLLYHPQEAYCDKPGVVPYKRANNVSGVTGTEAVLLGLAGLNAGIDGSLNVKPALPAKGEVFIKGFHCRGRSVDVRFTSKRTEVWLDGRETSDRQFDLSR